MKMKQGLNHYGAEVKWTSLNSCKQRPPWALRNRSLYQKGSITNVVLSDTPTTDPRGTSSLSKAHKQCFEDLARMLPCHTGGSAIYKEEVHPLSGLPAALLTLSTVDSRQSSSSSQHSTASHVLVCCALIFDTPAAAAASMAGRTWYLHWGCVECAGGSWRTLPHGWVTQPGASADAGHNAWSTKLEPLSEAGASSPSTVGTIMQVPLEGTVRKGGLVMVVKDNQNHWFKTAHGDIFLAAASLPGLQNAPENQDSAHKGSDQHLAAAAGTKIPKGSSTNVAELGVDVAVVQKMLLQYAPSQAPVDALLDTTRPLHSCSVDQGAISRVTSAEPGACRSLMHRFNAAADMMDELTSVQGDCNASQVALAASVAIWLRFSALRALTWNRNYNVKPREISTAQERLAGRLAQVYESQPPLRPLTLLALQSAGRGGAGDVGQRIRDEILSVQSRNNCKGGMMEEWHQKLHNNTSPDDVVICEALLAYLDSPNLDVAEYWATLKASGIDAARLASYDRSIRSEPRFSRDQVPGLRADLIAYLRTLKAVHSGDDLAAAAGAVLGYSNVSMKGKAVVVDPVQHVPAEPLKKVLASILTLTRQRESTAAAVGPSGQDLYASKLEATTKVALMVVEARHLIRPLIQAGNSSCGGRLKDLLFLDMALDATLRTAVEGSAAQFKAACSALAEDKKSDGLIVNARALQQVVALLTPVFENCVLSIQDNADLLANLKWLRTLEEETGAQEQRDRCLQLLAVLERAQRSLAELAGSCITRVQPTAEALGNSLGISGEIVKVFGEEVARGSSAAPLAQLLSVLEVRLRRALGSGAWQIISRGDGRDCIGRVKVVPSLESVQHNSYTEPVLLVVSGYVSGAEEVPQGAAAVLIPPGHVPDVLSHSAVRARNGGVIMAGCFDEQVMASILALDGRIGQVTLAGQDLRVEALE